MTSIAITGTVGRDVDLRFTSSGKAVVNFSVAENHNRKKPDGTWEQVATTWWRCQAWGSLAEHIAESITAGTGVVLIGRTETRKWSDKDGQERDSLEVTVDALGPSLRYATARVQKVERGSSGGSQQRSQAPADDPWGAPTDPSEPPF